MTIIYRHVQKTGEIKDFVITEESGIAKGIRRIIGVTGNEAKEVRRIGEALKVKLDQVEKLDGKEKDAALKSLTVVSSCSSLLSLWTSLFRRPIY